jgi:hypothetical protein
MLRLAYGSAVLILVLSEPACGCGAFAAYLFHPARLQLHLRWKSKRIKRIKGGGGGL